MTKKKIVLFLTIALVLANLVLFSLVGYLLFDNLKNKDEKPKEEVTVAQTQQQETQTIDENVENRGGIQADEVKEEKELLRTKEYQVPEAIFPQYNSKVGDEIALELFENETYTCVVSEVFEIGTDGSSLVCEIEPDGVAIFAFTKEPNKTLGTIELLSEKLRYEIVFDDQKQTHVLNELSF